MEYEYLTVNVVEYLIEEQKNFIDTIIDFNKLERWEFVSIENQINIDDSRLIKSKNIKFLRPKTN